MKFPIKLDIDDKDLAILAVFIIGFSAVLSGAFGDMKDALP